MVVLIILYQFIGRDAKQIKDLKRPVSENTIGQPFFLPPSWGGHHTVTENQYLLARSFHTSHQFCILHQRDILITPNLIEIILSNKNRLISIGYSIQVGP